MLRKAVPRCGHFAAARKQFERNSGCNRPKRFEPSEVSACCASWAPRRIGYSLRDSFQSDLALEVPLLLFECSFLQFQGVRLLFEFVLVLQCPIELSSCVLSERFGACCFLLGMFLCG